MVPFEAVANPTPRHLADLVSSRERRLEVGGNPPAEVSDRGDVDAFRDDQLRPRVAEEVLDRREGNGTDAFDLASLARLEPAAAEGLDVHVEDDLGTGYCRSVSDERTCGHSSAVPSDGPIVGDCSCAWGSACRLAGTRGRATCPGSRRQGKWVAERDESVGHVSLVSLPPAFLAGLLENLPGHRFKSVLDLGSFDRRQLTTDRDRALGGSPNVEVAALS